MGDKKSVIDIAVELGGIKSLDDANKLIETKMDAANLSKMNKIQNPNIRMKIANAISFCEPDSVFITTGSEEDRQFVRDLSLKKGEESVLPMDKHTIHYDLKEEQGRIIDRTF